MTNSFRYTGIVSKMAKCPLMIPRVYTGPRPFNVWVTNFENIATLNGWNADQQLRWLVVRLVVRAQIAFQNFTAKMRQSYDAAKAALQ